MMFATLAATAMMMSGAPAAQDWNRGGPQARGAPRGSYAQSCSGAYVNQGRLYADCRDNRGNTRETSIELNRCSSSDIGNDNGLLVCHNVRGQYEDRGGGNGGWNGGGNNGGGWGGGNGRESITVFRDADYRGPSRSFDGEVVDLSRTGFNDEISSMQFRGTWEACVDSYFRGECRTFNDSVRNLERWGMNDRISSLRPVGRRGGGRW